MICIAGTIFGFYYYYEQILSSPFWVWVFIPDSPVATLLYALSLILILFRRESNKLNIVSFILMVKTGIWTSAVLFIYFDYYFRPETFILRSFILITHLLMIPLAILLLPLMKKETPCFFLTILMLLLFSDIMDYVFDTHPWMPEKYTFQIGCLAISLSVSLILFLFFLLARKTRDCLLHF